ncbi:hypothetical protein J1N35_034680 [Gossypium stocksii]|uniref:DUF4283 domain-containing protein n=1 Tax=Gossypium stocksii TaxID=47602 RepID=A0A9D3UT15_9ROSI|nr:hypothetical protein J1N35_034680 [Gossypium stocksii]
MRKIYRKGENWKKWSMTMGPEEPLDLDDPVVNDKGMKVDSINVRTDDDEYLHAVSGRPWTIFGQYLTVWLWMPPFSMDQDFLNNLMI